MDQNNPATGGQGSARQTREVLRLHKGDRVLAEVTLGERKVVVGNSKRAKIRLKKKGLPEEILIIDARERPVVIESKLPADRVFLNGWAVTRGFFRPGDKIEFLGLVLELTTTTKARKKRAPAPKAPEDLTSPTAAVAARASMARARGRAVPQPPETPAVGIGETTATDLTNSELRALSDNTAPDFTAPEIDASQLPDIIADPEPLTPAPIDEPEPVIERFEPEIEPMAPATDQEVRGINPTWEGTTGELDAAILAAEAEIAKLTGEEGSAGAGTPLPDPFVEPELNEVPRGKTRPQAQARPRTMPQPPGPSPFEVMIQDPTATEDFSSKNPVPKIAQRSRRPQTRPPQAPPQAQAPPPQRQQAPPPPQPTGQPFDGKAPIELSEASKELDLVTPMPLREEIPPPGSNTNISELPDGFFDQQTGQGQASAPPPRFEQARTPPDGVPDPAMRPRQQRRPAVRPVRPAQPEVDFDLPRRRGGLRGFAVAAMILIILGGVGFGYYKLQIEPGLLGGRGAGEEIAANDTKTDRATTKGDTRKTRNTKRGTSGSKTTRLAQAEIETDDAEIEVDDDELYDTSGSPRAILGDSRFESAKVDTRDLDTGRNGSLRAAREMRAKDLDSIFLDAQPPTVRKYYPELWDPGVSYEGDSAELEEGRAQINTNRVNAKLKARYPQIKRCLLKSGGFRGKRARVVVNFTIYPNGRVSEVSIPSSGVSGTGFRSCVVRVISTTKFPRPKESSVVVIFPFVFTRN